MRDDLLDSQACVDWAVAQLDILRKRVADWINSRPYIVIGKEKPQSVEKTWHVEEVEPIPRIINAEVGAIINSVRSGLDVLVNSLAVRHGYTGKKDAYFPICLTFDEFHVGKHSGRKKIKRLSPAHQAAIELLQPYHGGDIQTLLWALHNLDIERKHRSLLQTHSSPHGIGVYRYGSLPPEFDKIVRKQPLDHGYVLPRGPTDPDYRIQIRIEVSLSHISFLTTYSVDAALSQLAGAAEAVINLFDC
jgi:hypothetical protein